MNFVRKLQLLKAFPWFAVYVGGDGQGDGGQGGGDGGQGDGDGGQGGDGQGGGDGGQGDQGKKRVFTQDELNKILADDRRKHQAQLKQQQDQVKKTIADLEALQKSKQLSDKERENLQSRIDELNTSLLTKEEQAKREMEKKDKEYKTQLETATKTANEWQSRYAEEKTTNEILQAADRHGAISKEQIHDFIMPKTRLVEELDEATNKPTGKWVPRVKFRDVTEKGTVELDLTIEEAIKRMKESPERFGNLFKSTSQGGLGANGSQGEGGGGNSNIPPRDPAQYRIWRKKKGYGSVRT